VKKPLLGTCSLCWGDTCVQVLSDLVAYNSRIKIGKKGADFGRKSRFPECPASPDNVWHDPHKVQPSVLRFQELPVEQCLALPDNGWLHRTMSGWLFQPDVHSRSLLYFANLVSVWSHYSSGSFVILWGSFISFWLVFFITLLQGVCFAWGLNLGHRLVLAKEFDLAPIHPPLIASHGPSLFLPFPFPLPLPLPLSPLLGLGTGRGGVIGGHDGSRCGGHRGSWCCGGRPYLRAWSSTRRSVPGPLSGLARSPRVQGCCGWCGRRGTTVTAWWRSLCDRTSCSGPVES
jgi:hypothetical protein